MIVVWGRCREADCISSQFLQQKERKKQRSIKYVQLPTYAITKLVETEREAIFLPEQRKYHINGFKGLSEIQKMTQVLDKHTFGVVSAISCGFHRKTLFWLLKQKIFILDITVVLSMVT